MGWWTEQPRPVLTPVVVNLCQYYSWFSLEMKNQINVVNHTELCARQSFGTDSDDSSMAVLTECILCDRAAQAAAWVSLLSSGYSSPGWTLSSHHLSLGDCVHLGQGHRTCMCGVYMGLFCFFSLSSGWNCPILCN